MRVEIPPLFLCNFVGVNTLFEYGVPRTIPHAAARVECRRDFDTPIPPETYANLFVLTALAVRNSVRGDYYSQGGILIFR